MLLQNLLCFIALLQVIQGKTYHGIAKSNDDGYFLREMTGNQCNYKEIWTTRTNKGSIHYASLSKQLWNDALHCGECIAIQPEHIQGNNITAMITSYFTSSKTDAGEEGLLLSPQAYSKMVNYRGGSRISIKWSFVPCPTAFIRGNMEYYFREGSTKNYLSIQPRNLHERIKKFELKDETNKKVYKFTRQGTFWVVAPASEKTPIEGAFTLRLTMASGKTFVDTYQEIIMDQTYETSGKTVKTPKTY